MTTWSHESNNRHHHRPARPSGHPGAVGLSFGFTRHGKPLHNSPDYDPQSIRARQTRSISNRKVPITLPSLANQPKD